MLSVHKMPGYQGVLDHLIAIIYHRICFVTVEGHALWAYYSRECLCSANQTFDVRLVGVIAPPTLSSPDCSTLLFKLRSQTSVLLSIGALLLKEFIIH